MAPIPRRSGHENDETQWASRPVPDALRDIVPFPLWRPSQAKAIDAGVLEGKSILVATPTASGKTVIAMLALREAVRAGKKGVYIAPLKALAAEKARDAKAYPFTSTLSVGDYDENDSSLADYDVIITTPEKLDSLLRHHVPWIRSVGCVVLDEVHLLGDSSRGPTLEILITILKHVLPDVQIVALSATVHNSEELAAWLGARLVLDTWRPVELREAVHTPEGVVRKETGQKN